MSLRWLKRYLDGKKIKSLRKAINKMKSYKKVKKTKQDTKKIAYWAKYIKTD